MFILQYSILQNLRKKKNTIFKCGFFNLLVTLTQQPKLLTILLLKKKKFHK